MLKACTIGIEGQYFSETDRWVYFIWCRTSPMQGYKKFFVKKTFFSIEEVKDVAIKYQGATLNEDEWLESST